MRCAWTPVDDETPNERFRDLVDLLFMKELAGDLVDIRRACEGVFERRGTHEWPPTVDPPEFWREPFAALAEQVDLEIDDLDDAVAEGQAFIDAIARADLPKARSEAHQELLTKKSRPALSISISLAASGGAAAAESRVPRVARRHGVPAMRSGEHRWISS